MAKRKIHRAKTQTIHGISRIKERTDLSLKKRGVVFNKKRF